jgi:RNA polymerase sigma-70 factor (ECF subfamily)
MRSSRKPNDQESPASAPPRWPEAVFRPLAFPTAEPDRAELLARLLAEHQEQLFRYILTLLPHEEDARDVLQEASVALYRKFAEYDPGKPFLAWAYRFAYLEVLKHRERSQRRRRLLSPDLVERLAREREEHESVLQARLEALEECLAILPGVDRELIRQRYQGGTPAEELARQSGASRRTFFRRLDRIRRVLQECINRRMAQDSSPDTSLSELES